MRRVSSSGSGSVQAPVPNARTGMDGGEQLGARAARGSRPDPGHLALEVLGRRAQGPRTPRQAFRITSAYRASHRCGWRATVAQGPFGAGPRAKAMSASRSSAGSSAIRSSSAYELRLRAALARHHARRGEAPGPDRERAQGGKVARLELGAHAGEPVAGRPALRAGRVGGEGVQGRRRAERHPEGTALELTEVQPRPALHQAAR